MGTLLQDLRFAVRMLLRNPSFTVAAVLTLGLGIGANTAMFSVLDAVLLRPLPFPRADELAVVWGFKPQIGREEASLPDYLDWREARSFGALAAYSSAGFNLNTAGSAEFVIGTQATSNFFQALGVTPRLGRFFRPEEETAGRGSVVVLSEAMWQQRFGGRRDALGTTISLSGVPYTIIGVAPAGLRLGRDAALWVPFRTDTLLPRRADFLHVFGRLRPGVTAAAAAAELRTIARGLEARFPASNAGWTVELQPLRDQLVGPVRTPLLLLMAAVGLVLLIACGNVANLLLARAAAREREVAVRLALGARPGRLVRQLLAESVLLAALGGGLGVVIAVWAIDGLRRSGDALLPRAGEIGLNLEVLGFTAALALVTGVVFGLAPALRLVRDGVAGLREGARGGTGTAAARRMRAALVLGQVAVALVLLVGAGLVVKSLLRLEAVEMGFRTDHVASARVTLGGSAYADDAQRLAFYQRVSDALAADPEVERAGWTGGLPLTGSENFLSFVVEGRPAPPNNVVQDAEVYGASPGYVEALRVPLLRGRRLEARDDARGAPVAVVSQAMARRYWPHGDPIGARISFDGNVWRTVIGVVGDVRMAPREEPYPQVYLPQTQNPGRLMYLAVRGRGDQAALVAAMRRAVESADRTVPLSDVQTMDQRAALAMAAPRGGVALIGGFAALALALAAVGIYGVVAYATAQRQRELGIRLALGAEPAGVIRLIVREAMLPVGLGVTVGIAAALAASRLLRSLLYGVAPIDPATYALVAGFVAVVALAASWLPARRAARIDPLVALRAE